ncbi:hypothetical protein CARUB_v10012716mg [Capsella rubella]|uniref:Uncharacterized protein n=1 Tax=Capsella rubella TaxID=81985 RepID=R0GLA5_9BRAS|nr:hypothetical protein CARUB_v10012716mg [Capsella rubella]
MFLRQSHRRCCSVDHVTLPPFLWYWSHVENCSSCKEAHKYLNALEVILQIASVAMIGAMAVMNQTTLSKVARIAVLCGGCFEFCCFEVTITLHLQDIPLP